MRPLCAFQRFDTDWPGMIFYENEKMFTEK